MSREYSRKEVLDIIEREANERGIPRDDFLRFAYIETGGAFDERVSRGPNGAKGLFQFVPSTAARYGIAGRELDPIANTDAAARLYLDNRRELMASHARTGHPYLSGKPEPDGLDMYMAHQQGAAGYRSIQAAITDGLFTRSDTRPHLLNNVGRRDLETITGVSFEHFSRMPDQEMAQTFVRYWESKYERIRIPEMGIGPVRDAGPPLPSRAPRVQEVPTTPITGRITLNRAHQLSIEHDDVRYRFGSKAVANGRIDCSGWVVMLQNATMNEINAEVGRAIFSRDELFNPGMDAAATIVQKAAQRSGILLQGSQVTRAALREGMVIGEDNGRTSFDAGRYRGIDHIVMVVRNPRSGELMVSQSRGGEGVEMMPVDRYLQDKQSCGARLYATDPLHEARALLEPATPPARRDDERERTPPARVTPANADGQLRYGESGPAVATLQIRLADLGYRGRDGKTLSVDGDFGDHTRYALQSFQREHGLQGLGVAGPRTEIALAGAERALMTHPSHPQHALFEKVLEKVHEAEAAKGLRSGHHSVRIAAALAVECLREGISRVDRVEMNANSLARAVQVGAVRDEPGLNRATDGISVPQAARQALAESTEQIHQVAVNLQAQQRDQQQRSQASVLAR